VNNLPKVGLRESFEMNTRDKYTKVECEVGMTVNGRELPNMAILGAALEEAIKLIQERVSESYKVVPPRNEFEQPAQPARPSPVGTVADLTSHPTQPVVKPVPFGS